MAAAAYRSGERIRDERDGKLHNFSRRTDVTHKEILLPSGLDASQIGWATDRSQLWNAAERAERARNARVAREYQVTLPSELSCEGRRNLARQFARELSDRYKVAVDLAIHNPRAAGDPRNFHAHLLMTSRQITPTGFGAKAGLDMSTPVATRLGLTAGIAEIRAVRERWANLANDALRSENISATIDHRSLRAQGLDRAPRHIPYGIFQRQRRALRDEVTQRIQAGHLARVRARNPQPKAEHPDVEDVRRQSREAWLKLRRGAATSAATSAAKEVDKQIGADRSTDSAIEDDLAL